jgi:hypothetical protein
MDEIAPWEQLIRSTALHQFVYLHEPWLWPTCEIIHYLGLSLLLGTVGLFDLRVLGIAKNIPPRAIHRLVPWGVGGYFLNVTTGVLFFSGHPDQYFYNNSGRLKALLMAVAGINVLVFYSTSAFPAMKRLEGGMDAPMRIKVIAGVSLAMWVGVLICGRMLTWFRPPFFH